MGYEIVPRNDDLPLDFDDERRKIVEAVKPYTLTSPERIFSLCQAVRHLTITDVDGAFVECGVWKGGSMMAACLELLALGDCSRDLFLFDTYEGMTVPDDSIDIDVSGTKASSFLGNGRPKDHAIWEDDRGCAVAPLDVVRTALESTGYPSARLNYVVGKVEDTLPASAPAAVALLRLDTDWYSSTRHELIHLFPRVVPGGVVIIDDYGHWMGARKAVDEYLSDNGIKMFLNRIDYSGRLGIVMTSPASDR